MRCTKTTPARAPLLVCGLTAAIVLFSCAATPSRFLEQGGAGAPAPVRVPVDFAGVCHAGNPVTQPENALLDELGLRWVRNDFLWTHIEPRPGVWDFSKYDAMVSDNKKAGRKVLGVLGFDNRWLFPDGKQRDYIAPEHLPRFLDYVEQTARRYKGQIGAWEIWNEPNIHFRFWNGPDKDYFALVKAAAARIKAVDPGAVVVAGVFWRVPAGFIQRMWRSGALENADVLSFHPYAASPAGVLALYERFEHLVRGLGFAGDIWVSEVGFPVGGLYPIRVAPARLGDCAVKTLTMLAAAGVPVVMWYQLTERYTRAERYSSLDSERYFGLAYKDCEKRSGVEIAGTLVHAIAGAVYRPAWPRRAGLAHGAAAFYFERPDGSVAEVAWHNNKPATVNIFNKESLP